MDGRCVSIGDILSSAAWPSVSVLSEHWLCEKDLEDPEKHSISAGPSGQGNTQKPHVTVWKLAKENKGSGRNDTQFLPGFSLPFLWQATSQQVALGPLLW